MACGCALNSNVQALNVEASTPWVLLNVEPSNAWVLSLECMGVKPRRTCLEA
jgi:hypothetical protein